MVLKGYDYSKVSVFAAISGGKTDGNYRKYNNFLSTFGFARFNSGSDSESFLQYVFNDNNGIGIIAGTGSSTFVKVGLNVYRYGGFGYQFDAGGSGFTIGKDAIRAALMHEDGSGEKTLIYDYIKQKIHCDSVVEEINSFYRMTVAEIASFSPLVTEAYKKGDNVAKEILIRNMHCVADNLCAGARLLQNEDKVVKIVIMGGLMKEKDLLLPLLIDEIDKKPQKFDYDISVFSGDTVYGALLCAGLDRKFVGEV